MSTNEISPNDAQQKRPTVSAKPIGPYWYDTWYSAIAITSTIAIGVLSAVLLWYYHPKK